MTPTIKNKYGGVRSEFKPCINEISFSDEENIGNSLNCTIYFFAALRQRGHYGASSAACESASSWTVAHHHSRKWMSGQAAALVDQPTRRQFMTLTALRKPPSAGKSPS